MAAWIHSAVLKWFGSPAQVAGGKAARSWRIILEHTGDELEELTGHDLYTHACEEARQWLRSVHRIPSKSDPRTITFGGDPALSFKNPEQRYHKEFLEYVEAFVSTFPPRMRGYPKD